RAGPTSQAREGGGATRLGGAGGGGVAPTGCPPNEGRRGPLLTDIPPPLDTLPLLVATDLRRYGCRINPQTSLGFPCFFLQPFKHCVSWRMLPVPPPPTVLHYLLIEYPPVWQEHVSNSTPVLVTAKRLER